MQGVGDSRQGHNKRPPTIVMEVDGTDSEGDYVRVRRAVRYFIKAWVEAYGKPIRRKKLVELVCFELRDLCERNKKSAMRTIGVVISKMVRRGEVVKVLDVYNRKAVYYILPEHLEMFRDRIVGRE